MNVVRQKSLGLDEASDTNSKIDQSLEAEKSPFTIAREKPRLWMSTVDEFQNAALKRELLLCGGCIIMILAIGAASTAGLVITAFFVLISIGNIFKKVVLSVIGEIRNHVALRR
ncbi:MULTISPECIES: hypothetical protein [Rhizobium]|uniref:Uncharacterized protein n=1 Tax=Rhizobium rhododendri TaxID=2506430 RepID=A0ABY8IT84_9HYPH|nr:MULTISPECIES: hypothetical protein [Rhizobium]TQX82765.1 hypothetical protein EQW76_27740 [Rhizobium sp. rho-13.1]TQY05936.1 hypothetical protein EQW74_26885 [Rhizobium sp. rho-1.1]WFS26363.1 hypothetical protein PR018_25440 [Rhizobium rhododendri]